MARRNPEIKEPRYLQPSLHPSSFSSFFFEIIAADLIFSINSLHEISTIQRNSRNYYQTFSACPSLKPKLLPHDKISPDKIATTRGCERLSKVTRPTRPFVEGRRKRCLVQRTGIPKFPPSPLSLSPPHSLDRTKFNPDRVGISLLGEIIGRGNVESMIKPMQIRKS